MASGFREFVLLPAELRAMVWAYVRPEPRVYEVMDVPGARLRTDPVAGLMFANVHNEPPPPLAAVCRECRDFVLHHYRPLTLSRTTKYVDLGRDLLLLEPYLLLERLHRTLRFMGRIPLIRDHLAGLALGASYGCRAGIDHPVLSRVSPRNHMARLLAALTAFPRLRLLLFVVHQEFRFVLDSQLSWDEWEWQPQVMHRSYRFSFHIESSMNSHRRQPHRNELLFYPLEKGNMHGYKGGYALHSNHGGDGGSGGEDHENSDWESLLNSGGALPNGDSGGGDGDGDGDGDDNGGSYLAYGPSCLANGRPCHQWPTNNDWQKFRRQFQRAVVATLQEGLASSGNGQNRFCVDADAAAAAGTVDGGRLQAATAPKPPNRAAARSDGKGCTEHRQTLLDAHMPHDRNGLYNLHRSSHAGSGGGLQRPHSPSKSSAEGRSRRYTLKHSLPDIKGASLLWRYTRGELNQGGGEEA